MKIKKQVKLWNINVWFITPFADTKIKIYIKWIIFFATIELLFKDESHGSIYDFIY